MLKGMFSISYLYNKHLLLILPYRKKVRQKCVIEGGSCLEGAKLCYIEDQKFNASNKYYNKKLLITKSA
jgi:hypothetical protein